MCLAIYIYRGMCTGVHTCACTSYLYYVLVVHTSPLHCSTSFPSAEGPILCHRTALLRLTQPRFAIPAHLPEMG